MIKTVISKLPSSITAENQFHNTPLHIASSNSFAPLKAVEMLVACGDDFITQYSTTEFHDNPTMIGFAVIFRSRLFQQSYPQFLLHCSVLVRKN